MSASEQSQSWLQVLGTFDLDAGAAQITSVQPALRNSRPLEGGEDRVRVKGFDRQNHELFNYAVNPMRNSCAPLVGAGSFEEFVPITDSLAVLRLFVDGTQTAQFAPGEPPALTVGFGVAAADRPHIVPLMDNAVRTDNVTYTVQARPNGEDVWQTIGIGLHTASSGEINANQFPGAKDIEVRVIQNTGFSETEVYRGIVPL